MDKRTILYVALVAVSFFGLNFMFSQQREQQTKQEMAERETKRQAQAQAQAQELASRTVQIQDLPLIALDDYHQGILSQGAVLTLAWQQTMPQAFTVEGVTYQLRTQFPVVGSPVLYASPQFNTLTIPSLEDQPVYDVQLLSFPKQHAAVSLAELSHGDIQILGSSVTTDALVLYRQNQTWLVAGVYENSGRVFIPLQDLPLFATLVQVPQATPLKAALGQKYYVLENETVQLVFTNVGGALAEINLPLRTGSDTESVVNEIGFDKQIAETSPQNALFPLFSYDTSKGTQEASTPGGYYPLLRRSIKTAHGVVSVPPSYYALNIVSDYPEMAEMKYAVEKFTADTIVFVASQSNRKITKTFTLLPSQGGTPYCFQLSVRVDGDARGLWLTSGIPDVEIMSNSSSPQVQYRVIRKGKGEMESLSLPKAKETISSVSVQPDWMVNSNGYLGIILDPLTEIGTGYKVLGIPGNALPTRLSLIDPKHHPYPANKYPGYEVLLPLPAKPATSQFLVYAGPFEEGTLKAVDRHFTQKDGAQPHFTSARTFYGWFSFISRPFAQLLFVVMQFFYYLTHSWGFSIILLTVFLRVILYPLNAWSIKSMRRMQKISPQVQAIQQKYKKDPKRSQMELMALYREKKVNPFMGCVPILIQLPFLIAMFDLLKSSFQLRGASFIPGWIDNLTAPDVLFSWQTPVFFFGTQLHLLPFLLGGVMFLQQLMTSGLGHKEMTDQQRQQRAMATIMTAVFTLMFYNFPSGLNLYWLSSMVLGIGQQWIMNKILDKKKEKPELIVPNKKK